MANPWDMDWSQQGQQGQQGNPWEQDWSQTSQQALISGGDPFDELDNPDPSNNPLVGAFQRAAELGAGATDVVGNVFQSAGDVIESLVPPAVTEALTPDFLRVENPFKVAAEGVRRDVEPLYEATVPWEAVKEDPSIGNIATFAAEQGIRSIPDMLAAVNPGTLPGYITARSGELGTIRAENKGLPTAGLQENVEALPGAIASAALERIGGRGALGLGRSAKDIGKQILTRPAQTTLRESAKAVGKAGVKEAATEFGQEQIDYATEVLGTNKVWTLAQSLDRGLAGAVGGGPTGATIRGSVETVRQIAQRKNKAPEDVTIEDVAEEANQGNTAAAEILRSTGASEEQIAAIDETRQQEMANIVEARREEEAARGAPQDAAGFNNQGARRTKEGVLLDRQPRGSVWEDVVRQQKQDEKIALGEMDPAVAPETGRVREPVPDVMPVTPEGQVDAGDAGITTALERGRGRPTTETALVPQEPQPTRMTPAEIAAAQRRMDAGQPRGAAVDEDMDVRRAEDTVFGQEGRAPQTRDDLQGQRQAGEAFTLADRQRQRAGEGVADTQTAGRPEGAAQVDVTLHEGFPVKVTGLQVNPNTNKPEVEIQRYDPRTGEVEPGSEPYIVEAAELQSSRYATDPRRAQDVEARSQVDRVARGKAKGQRIDEFQDLPRQTYRTTEPDPEVQGAEGPFTDVQDRGPGVRADRPPQDEGPSPFKERSTTEEEAIRQAEAFAKEQAQKERARQERAEQARQRGEEPQPEFEDDGGEFESRKSTIKPAKVGKDGYYPTHDYKGVRYVLSDGGGPIIFGTQKQAAKWINKVANIAANDDQFFVFATHPFKQGKPDAKGMSESLYTVVETKRNPEGRKESAQAEASAKAQAESDKTSRRATFAEADAAERASDARRRAQSEPGQQRGIPGEVSEAEPEPEPEPQPEPVSPGGEGALGRVKNPQLWSIPQDQEYKSIKTSINMRRLPVGISKGIKAGYFNDGTINLDIGGGRYDNTTEALIEEGVTNYTYDPFNRTVEENAEAVNNAADGQADTVTVHNTLNTIKEARYRDRVLRQAWSALKPGGRLMITVYAGDKTGQGRATQNNDSWQENRPLSSYLNEVKRHFKNVRQEAGVLIATKDVAAQPQPQPQPQPEPEAAPEPEPDDGLVDIEADREADLEEASFKLSAARDYLKRAGFNVAASRRSDNALDARSEQTSSLIVEVPNGRKPPSKVEARFDNEKWRVDPAVGRVRFIEENGKSRVDTAGPMPTSVEYQAARTVENLLNEANIPDAPVQRTAQAKPAAQPEAREPQAPEPEPDTNISEEAQAEIDAAEGRADDANAILESVRNDWNAGIASRDDLDAAVAEVDRLNNEWRAVLKKHGLDFKNKWLDEFDARRQAERAQRLAQDRPAEPEPEPEATDLGPPGPAQERSLNLRPESMPRTQAQIEGRLDKRDEASDLPTLNKEQKKAAKAAQTETNRKFDEAIEKAGPKTSRAREYSGREKNQSGGWKKANYEQQGKEGNFEHGWDDVLSGKVDDKKTDTTKSYTYNSSYAEGVKQAQEWKAANPGAQPLTVTIEATTARGQKTTFTINNDAESISDVKRNFNKRDATKFYSFPGAVFDPEVYKDISRDLKKVLKATTSLTSAVTRPVRNIARTALAASDQHMRADLKERGLLTPTAEKILNIFHAEAGKAGEVDQTFFEAVESRAGEQYNKLSRALGKYVDDAESVAQIVKLLRGNPRALRAGTPLHDAAIEVRKILDENLQYMREAGVEIGEVKTGYFPREMDTDMVMRDQGGFELAAAQAYRETGMNAKAARDAAAALYEELIFGHLNSPRQGGGASAPFVRGRVFTKAVDNESHPLNKFLVQDHVGSLTQYLGRATRRAEIARRFGDNFANMADLEQQLKDEGSGEIIPELAAHIEIMTGTAVRGQRGDLKMLQNIRMWSALMYLERATLSSLGEIVMPAVRTGNALDLGSAFAETIKGFRKQNKSEARDMAEDLGIITGHVGESIMTSRHAGEDISGQKTARVLDRYFRRIGLEQFTEATRVASTKIGNVFIRRMAKRIAAGGKQAKLSTEFLAELGVPAAKAQEFSAWMMKSDGFPTDISGEMGSIYKKAIWRFVDQTIMRPNKSVKPRWANSNLGQVVYHLQAFTLTFYQQVVKRSGRLAKRAFSLEKGLSVPDRARLLAPALMLPVLFAFQAAISEIRDELTMDEERRKKETGTTRLLKWASRTGLFGAADPYVNLVQASSRYNRSAVDSLIGPGLGAAGKMADATLAVTLNDSPTTNTQERKMMRAFYDVALEPMLNYQLSQRIGPAAGPIARATGAALTQIAGAGKTKEVFLSATAGPYKKSGRKSSRWSRPTR